MRTLTLPDRFIEQPSPAAVYANAGMTAVDIAAMAAEAAGADLGRVRARA